jgi:hypothetical protein
MKHIIEQQKERANKASTGVDLQNRTWVETKDVHTIIEETHQATIDEVEEMCRSMEKPINISDPIHIQEWGHGYHQALTELIEAITNNKE